MVRTVSKMIFQASLVLAVVSATSLAESRHEDTQRLLRVETEQVELNAKGMAKRQGDDIVYTYKNKPFDDWHHDIVTAHKKQDNYASVSHDVVMAYKEKGNDEANGDDDDDDADGDDDGAIVEKAKDGSKARTVSGGAGPCKFLVQIAHANKGAAPQIWRTVMVNGSRIDKFHFEGCTTEGQEAAYCKNIHQNIAGVRVMKNRNGQAVQFGSCCKAEELDSVVASRIQHCEPEPMPAVDKSIQDLNNSTGIVRGIYHLARELPWLKPSELVTLSNVLMCGFFVMVLISGLMYSRFKK